MQELINKHEFSSKNCIVIRAIITTSLVGAVNAVPNMLCNACQVTAFVMRQKYDYSDQRNVIHVLSVVLKSFDKDCCQKSLWNKEMLEKFFDTCVPQ